MLLRGDGHFASIMHGEKQILEKKEKKEETAVNRQLAHVRIVHTRVDKT